jgi:hypothetical protein
MPGTPVNIALTFTISQPVEPSKNCASGAAVCCYAICLTQQGVNPKREAIHWQYTMIKLGSYRWLTVRH